MGIRDVVSVVPAKPIIAAALAFTLAAAGWNMSSNYRVCSHRAALTDRLHLWAGDALRSGEEGLELAAGAAFEWQQVRISQNVQEEAEGLACPFGWHWSEDERTALKRAGALTYIGFFSGDTLVEIVDFDGRIATFDMDSDPIARADAVFAPGAEERVLTLVQPE